MTDKQRIKQLEDSLLMYERSPYMGGYIAVLKQITQWNNEMSLRPIKLAAVEDDDMKAFDKAMKFLEKQKLLYETLDFLRSKMTVKEKEDIDKLEISKNSVEDFLLGE
jgi:hypothetical protein